MIEQVTSTPQGPGWSLGRAEGGGGRSGGQPCLSARIHDFEPQGQTQQEAGPQETDASGLRDALNVQEVQAEELLPGGQCGTDCVRQKAPSLEKVSEAGSPGTERGGGGGLRPGPVPAGTPGGDAPFQQLAGVSTWLDSPAQEHPLPSSRPSFVKVDFQGSIFLCLFLNLRI